MSNHRGTISEPVITIFKFWYFWSDFIPFYFFNLTSWLINNNNERKKKTMSVMLIHVKGSTRNIWHLSLDDDCNPQASRVRESTPTYTNSKEERYKMKIQSCVAIFFDNLTRHWLSLFNHSSLNVIYISHLLPKPFFFFFLPFNLHDTLQEDIVSSSSMFIHALLSIYSRLKNLQIVIICCLWKILWDSLEIIINDKYNFS